MLHWRGCHGSASTTMNARGMLEIFCCKSTRQHFGSVSVCVLHIFAYAMNVIYTRSGKLQPKMPYIIHAHNERESYVNERILSLREVFSHIGPVCPCRGTCLALMENILQLSFLLVVAECVKWWQRRPKKTTTTTTLADTNKLKSGDRIDTIKAATATTLWDTTNINICNALIVSSIYFTAAAVAALLLMLAALLSRWHHPPVRSTFFSRSLVAIPIAMEFLFVFLAYAECFMTFFFFVFWYQFDWSIKILSRCKA